MTIYRHEFRAFNVNEGIWTPCGSDHRSPGARDRCDVAWHAQGCETRPYRDMDPLSRSRERDQLASRVLYVVLQARSRGVGLSSTDIQELVNPSIGQSVSPRSEL